MKAKLPPLTPEQAAAKAEFERVRGQIDAFEELLLKMTESCKHEVHNGVCVICASDFGWPCNKSPDKVCHYFSDGAGFVELINGTKHAVDSDPDNETHDSCLFCGDPEERK